MIRTTTATQRMRLVEESGRGTVEGCQARGGHDVGDNDKGSENTIVGTTLLAKGKAHQRERYKYKVVTYLDHPHPSHDAPGDHGWSFINPLLCPQQSDAL